VIIRGRKPDYEAAVAKKQLFPKSGGLRKQARKIYLNLPEAIDTSLTLPSAP